MSLLLRSRIKQEIQSYHLNCTLYCCFQPAQRQEERKGIQIARKVVELYLFTDGVIIHVASHMESTKKQVRVMFL